MQSLSLGRDSEPSCAPLVNGCQSHMDMGSESPIFCLGHEHFWSPLGWKNSATLGPYPCLHCGAVRTWCGCTCVHAVSVLCVCKPTTDVMVNINMCIELCCLQKSSLYVCLHILFPVSLGHRLLFILASTW